MSTVDEFFTAAMTLPLGDRQDLALRLWEAAQPSDFQPSPELQELVADRIALYEAGAMPTMRAEQAMAMAREALAKRP